MNILENQTTAASTERHVDESSLATLISDNQIATITLVNYVAICGFVSVFGIFTNLTNLVIFYRQGLNSTTNISFFAMAVSDLCGVLIQQLFNIYINPLFEDLHLPIRSTDVQHLTSCVPRALFSRITCLITVFMTAERCLCVAFPLHIKQMITTKRTTIVMIIIYGTTLSSSVPLYATNYLGWKFYPEWNQTLLGIITSKEKESATAVVYFIHSFSGLISFLAVVVLTVILLTKLREKSSWRKTVNIQQDKSLLSSRDTRIMTMVIIIASILIICYIPSTLLSVITVWEPEFGVGGKHYNVYNCFWSISAIFENINSSVNIFLYLKMSSKYRVAFYQLFAIFGKIQLKQHDSVN